MEQGRYKCYDFSWWRCSVCSFTNVYVILVGDLFYLFDSWVMECLWIVNAMKLFAILQIFYASFEALKKFSNSKQIK